jgi:hypothetical protein
MMHLCVFELIEKYIATKTTSQHEVYEICGKNPEAKKSRFAVAINFSMIEMQQIKFVCMNVSDVSSLLN